MARRAITILLCILMLIPVVEAADLNAAEERILAQFIAAEAEDAPYAVHLAMAAALLNRLADNRYPDTVSGILSTAGYRTARRTPAYDSALSAVRTAAAGMDFTDGATVWARSNTEKAAAIRVTFSAAGWVFGTER